MRDAVDELDWLQRTARSLDEHLTASVSATIEHVRLLLGQRWLPLLAEVVQWCRLGAGPPAQLPTKEHAAPSANVLDDLVTDVQQWSLDRLVVVWQLTSHPTDAALLTRLVALDQQIADGAARLSAAACAGGAQQSGDGTADEGVEGVLDRLDPYAAALVLGHLDLAGRDLATQAERVLRRWHDGPPTGDGRSAWTDRALAGPDTGDLVAELVAADPLAARILLVLTASSPEVVLEAPSSTESLERLLRAGLDPAVLDTATAGRVVPAFTVATFVDATAARGVVDPARASAREALAPSLAPWLLQFGPRAEDWGWPPAAADAALQAVLADPHGAMAMRDAQWQWVGRAAVLAAAGQDGPQRQEIDAIVAALEQVRLGWYDIGMAAAVRDQRTFDGILDVGQALVGLAPLPGGFMLGRLTGFGVELQRQRLEADLRRAGIVGRHPDQVAVELDAATDQDRATAAFAALTATVDHLLADGRIPPPVAAQMVRAIPGDAPAGCAAAHVREVLLGRLDALDTRIDASTREVLATVILAFTADIGDRRSC